MERDGGAGGVDRKVFSGGDASIFSSADGLQRLAKTRSGSRQSSRGGSEKSGRGSRGDPPRPDHSAQVNFYGCLLYTSPSPRDVEESRMPSSA